MKNIAKLLLVLGVAFTSLTANAQVSVGLSIRIAPPAIPVYVQPACPADGYLWTPGYWAYGDDGYYWVPGVWVRPPHYGVLWTPGYWGYERGFYGFHAGYWGPHVGFYGGVNYGFGYGGYGFGGGVWQGSVFRYNTAVMRVNTTVVHNTYIDRTVIRNTTVNRTSFNGPGGINARPRPEDRSAMSERHFQPTGQQLSHQQNASHDRSQFAAVNHGAPANTAMNKVNGRSFNQQGRIANGVKSGSLTPRETQHLENRQGNLNHEVHSDRQANGGTLTPQEHWQVDRQQNQASRQIYNDKHNANNTRPQPQPRSERQFAPRQQQPGGGHPAGGFGGGHPNGGGGHGRRP